MISNALLTSYFQARYALTPGGTASGAPRKTPTAPWEGGSTAPQASELTKAVLAGRKFIDPSAAQLDVKGASGDYRKLFGLFQGLNALNALAERAEVKNVPRAEVATLSRRFAAGMAEVNSYMATLKLEQARLYQGEVTSRAQGSVGVPRDKLEYLTGVVHSGAMDAVSPALTGSVKFGIEIAEVGQPLRTIDIDLDDMGAEPRTFGAVILHVNARLEAAGVETRLARERLAPVAPAPGGVTAAVPERWALKVVGDDDETVRFTAPATSDAVYVAQAAGAAPKTPDGAVPVQQLLKFQTDVGGAAAAVRPAEQGTIDDANWVEGRAFSRTLGPEVAAVRATAAAPDGGVYVLGEVTSATAGQTLQGVRDVALMRYDSAGQLLFTRTLGAADEASGVALAVGPDGQVAVAGRVTGALGGTDASIDAKTADSFATLFDGEGQELWTRRRGGVGDDEAKAVAIGADGRVYVGGRTRSGMPGGGEVQGGWDGYVQAFDGLDGRVLGTRQFGAAGDDGVSALAVSGSSLVVGGLEGGRGVLRAFTVDAATGAMTAGQTRDLGTLNGGAVAGVAFKSGEVVVAGESGAALSAGAATNAYGGGRDGFVAVLAGDLGAGAGDRVTYVGGAGEDRVSALSVVGDMIYVAGASTGGMAGTTAVGTRDGFLLRLDGASGTVEQAFRYAGKDGEVAPTSIAVAAGGASVLDRLGLPQGEIDYSDSKLVTAATSARAGDQLLVRTREGARGTAVTLEANDTLKTLAAKITRALGFNGKAEVVKDGDVDRLRITARNDRAFVELAPGPGGRNLLETLGLADAVVQTTRASTAAGGRKAYGLTLDRELNLSSPEQVRHAMAELQTAMVAVRKLFRDLKAENDPAPKPVTGAPSAYMQGQIANYQAALERLGG